MLVGAGAGAVGVNALRDRNTGGTAGPTASSSPSGSASPSTSASPTEAALPADEQCTDAIQQNERWVCLVSATFDGLNLTITYKASFAGADPNVKGGYHLHVYGGDGTKPAEERMGTHADNPGSWYVEDEEPSVRKATSSDYRQAIGDDAEKVCARIANASHELVPDLDGGYHTGNCIPIQRL
jgi:molecular chaperone DnaK